MKHFLQISLVIILMLLCSGIYSQKVLVFPNEYLKSNSANLNPFEVYNSSEQLKKTTHLSDNLWIVYSDRENNLIVNYDSLNVHKPYDSLIFLERCVVLDLSFDRELNNSEKMLITREVDLQPGTKYSADPKESFWINWDKLILSPHCEKLNVGSINNKAMTLYKIEKTGNSQFESWGKEITYYKSPINDCINNTNGQENSFMFKFVYKYSANNDFLLLGNAPDIISILDSDHTKEINTIIGWMHRSRLIEWDHRTAWELNWNPLAYESRDTEICCDRINIDTLGCLLFTENDYAQDYYKNGLRTYCTWDQSKVRRIEGGSNMYRNRLSGISYRYNLLDCLDFINNCHFDSVPRKLGLIKMFESVNESIILDEHILNEIGSRAKIIETNSRKINLIFVIDATSSILKHNSSIGQAISDAMDRIRNSDVNDSITEYRFGAVLFRDSTETNVVHIYDSLTSDFHALGAWIKDTLISKFNNFDKDPPEALFFGIDTAIDHYGTQINRLQTNYLMF